MRNRQVDSVQHFVRVRPFVLKNYVSELDGRVFGDVADQTRVFGFLIRFFLNFVQAFERDFRILRGLHETDELRYGGVELADDVLHGHHHTERHFPIDDGTGGKERDDNILGLVDERTAYFLCLSECQALDRNLEQFGLDTFPFPAFLLLAVIQLDVLHAVDKLDDIALVVGRLLKTHVVQLAAAFEEYQYPQDIKTAAEQEYAEDAEIVPGHHDAVYDERHGGHHDTQQRTGQECLDPVVIPDALHDVPDHLRIEKRDGQAHEFGQKVRNERDTDACGHVEHQPRADEVVGHLSERQHHLCDENHDHERKVAVPDTRIDDRLGQERKNQTEYGSNQHRKAELEQVGFVRPQITQHRGEIQPFVLIALLGIELRFRLQQEGNAFGRGIAGKVALQNRIFGSSLQPRFEKLSFAIFE